MIEIRPYTVEDYGAVAANLHTAEMFDETWDTPENLNGLAFSVDPRNSILVAEQAGKVVGNVVSTAFGPQVAFFWRLNVREDYRKQGVATRLLTTLKGNLEALGVVEVCALVDSDKQELLDFYERQGFRYSKHSWKVIWQPNNG